MNKMLGRAKVSFAALLLAAGCATPLQQETRANWERVALAADAASSPDASLLAIDAADPSPMPSDLADYLRIAALNSPALKAAFERWKAALERMPQLRSLPDPKFTYGFFIREVETRVGAQKQRVGLMQAFPWLSKLRLRGDLAARQARVHQHLYDAEKLKLFFQVRNVYYEYFYLARAIEIVGENMELLSNLEAAIRVRYAAGAASHPNLIQTQVELGKLEDRLKSLQDLRPALVARLNAVLGRDITTPIPWPGSRPKETEALDQDELLAALAEDNPELKAALARIRAAQTATDLARLQFYPDFALGLNYIQTDPRSDMGPSDNGKDPVLATFQMTLPLWYEKNRAAVREASAKRSAAQFARANQVYRLSADLRVALYHYDDARRKVNLFRDTLVPKAQQALTAAMRAFAAGKGRFLDVIDTERSLLEFRLLAERALANQAIRLAELEQLAGRGLRTKKGGTP